jgi:Cu-Zn family superoxide dismutase
MFADRSPNGAAAEQVEEAAILSTRETIMKPSLVAILLSSMVAGCGGGGEPDADDAAPALEPASEAAAESTADSARADIIDARGVGIGAVYVTSSGDGVALDGALIGLPPGEHGFHIHETGACEPPGFESAGDHLGAADAAHGTGAVGGPHAGDLRNLTVAADSTATVDQTNDRVTVLGGAVELLDDDGSALVVHAMPDDYLTQPSGGSGERIACGVIGK